MLCDLATSSDALLNALFVSKIFKERGSLLAYTRECVDIPYRTVDVRLTEDNAILSAATSLQSTADRIVAMYPNCRLVLRKSGTENKVRAYAEGADAEHAIDCVVATFAQRVARADS